MCNTKKRKTKAIGQFGEDLAVRFLVKNGFKIIERNYTNKVGEIDIIAIKDKILRFIEVKTVLRETSSSPHNPEDNVHKWKLEKIATISEIYLISNESMLIAQGIIFDDFQIDAVAVTIRKDGKRFTSNIRFFEGAV